MWGGGQSWFTRATATSTAKSPLTTLFLRPELVASPDGTGFRDISFGHKHAAFITGSGKLYTYGSGEALGHGEKVLTCDSPRLVEGLPPVVEVQCGAHHTVVLAEDGTVYTFGKGSGFMGIFGTPSALGIAGGASAPRPVQLTIGESASRQEKIVQIAVGSTHTMARTAGGQVYGWGNGASGRLGTGSSSSETTPVLLTALSDKFITHISCGSSFNGALTKEGEVYMSGDRQHKPHAPNEKRTGTDCGHNSEC